VQVLWGSDLWSTENYRGLRSFLLETLKRQPRPYLLRAFLNAYLDTFHAPSERTKALGQVLKQNTKRLPASIQLLAQDYELFSPDAVVDNLAMLLEDLDDPFTELKTYGIQSPHALGLMEAVHKQYLENLGDRLARADKRAQEHILNWVAPDRIASKFDSMAARSLDAILLPLENGVSTLSDEMRDELAGKISGKFGDPRVSMRSPWATVDPRSLSVMKLLLTGASFRVFLDVVTKVIVHQRDHHMWPNRRQFWESLWEKGEIVDAWVILSRDGEREARQLSETKSSMTSLAYGKADFSGAARDEGKCFLLIRLSEQCGGKVVLEGSHNFRVHIYEPNDEACPDFHKPTYPVSDLRREGSYMAISHFANWINKVTRIIYSTVKPG
jgi:hypothetical protein